MSAGVGTLTAVGNTVQVGPFNPDPEIIVQVSGTYAGITFVIESSTDGANWNLFPGVSTEKKLVNTFTPASNETKFISVVGIDLYSYLRVRCTAFTSGSMAVTLTTYPQASNASGANGNLVVFRTPGSVMIPVTPVVTASGYSSGNVIGGVLAFPGAVGVNSLAGTLQRLCITSKNNIQPTLHIYLFSQNPNNGTYTDKAALSWNATDFGFVIGCINIASGNWFSDGSEAVMDVSPQERIVLATQTLYMLCVIQGSFTPGSTSDFTFKAIIDSQG